MTPPDHAPASDIAATLLAIEQIRMLKARYFRFLDTKDWAGIATIFTPDAVFDARASFTLDPDADDDNSKSSTWIYEGRTVIARFIEEALTGRITTHQGYNHEIEILGGGEARGVIGMEDRVITRQDGRTVTAMHGWGHYHERYRLTPEGWCIAHSRITRLDLDLVGF